MTAVLATANCYAELAVSSPFGWWRDSVVRTSVDGLFRDLRLIYG